MTRLLELVVALVMVFILAVIVGIVLPSKGHVERSITVSKDVRHVYDLLDNFRRFPQYSVLGAHDPNVRYQQTPDDWYGPGASISWTSNNKDVGDGKLTIVSAKPNFDQVGLTGEATLVWSLDNDWHGSDKQFTIHIQRTGRFQKLVQITWAYDVHYGWNLINRYAGLYIHGKPDSFIQFSLNSLQNILATIPNIAYGALAPQIVQRPQQPVLVVATSSQRLLDKVDAASDAAVDQIQAAMKKLGLHQTGPRIRFTTNFGDENYLFSVAIPVDKDSVTIDGKQYTFGVAHAPTAATAAAGAASSAGASSVAGAGSVATPGSAAAATSSGKAKAGTAVLGPRAGTLDDHGRLIINANVRGMMAFGGTALEAVWYGSPAGIPPTRLRLKTYAQTHGYPFDDVTDRLYDVQIEAYGSPGPDGQPLKYDEQMFKVYLPLKAAPKQTPEQAAGMKPVNPFVVPGSAGSVPGNAASAPANAGSAPAAATTSH